jgi:tetratricopeptide (TPR) repeat protein
LYSEEASSPVGSREDALRRQADALVKTGDALLAQEKRTEAVLQFQRAVVLYAELEAKPDIGRLKLRIAEALLALDQIREGEFFAEQALGLLHAWGEPTEVARCYHLLGFCQQRSGRADEARRSLEAAAFLFEQGGDAALAREARDLARKA